MSPLKRFDIIRGNSTFVHGSAFPKHENGPRYVNIGRYSPCDETRNGALFLVLQVNAIKRNCLTWDANEWTEVLAVRLKSDGQYDPDGEVIRFEMGTRDGVHDVEVVHQALIATMIPIVL